MGQSMNLHIIPDEAFFVDIFIELLWNAAPDWQNKCVVNSATQPVYVQSNVPYARYGTQEFTEIVGDLAQYDRVFIHFLTDDMCKLIVDARLPTRFFWVFWGADLYRHIRYSLYDAETYELLVRRRMITRRYEFVSFFTNWKRRHIRRLAIKKVEYILHYNRSEYDLILENFSTQAKYSFFFYLNVIPWPLLNEEPDTSMQIATKVKLGVPLDSTMILLGNSGAETNNHLPILRQFALDTSRNERIIVPLSYGNPVYISYLVEEGKRLLGERFVPVLEYLSPADYAHILKCCDFGIFNAHRAQGVGNIIALLFLGKRIFLNRKARIYDFLQENNVFIEPVEKLKDLSNGLLLPGLSQQLMQDNKKRIYQLFSEQAALNAISKNLTL
jgi:dTDP-N-acetylfucosamine:lipid II N-acetylfucosaminyltransferase